MYKFLLLAALAAILSGCAIDPIQKGLLSKPGVELTDTQSRTKYLESVTISRPNTPAGSDRLPFCVAKSVPHETFTLQGGSEGYVNWFTGFYNVSKDMREVGAGAGRHFVSDDGMSVVTRGTAKYDVSTSFLKITRGIAYTLTMQPVSGRMKYQFSDIKQAQLNTGSIANDGFNKVGAWAGAEPVAVYNQLVSVADAVNRCIGNSS